MEKQYTLEDILAMERSFRRDFMNTISGYRSCHLLGTLSYNKAANLGVFNSITHIGATPPHLGFIMRPLTVPRQTYHNIKAQGYFTLNQVTQDMMHQAHQAAAKYDPDHSEFEAVGLQPQYTERHLAPYVKESPIKLGLELAEEHHIQANGAIFVVGKVIEVLIEEKLIADDGHILLEEAGILSVAGLDSYYQPELIDRLDYPRP